MGPHTHENPGIRTSSRVMCAESINPSRLYATISVYPDQTHSYRPANLLNQNTNQTKMKPWNKNRKTSMDVRYHHPILPPLSKHPSTPFSISPN